MTTGGALRAEPQRIQGARGNYNRIMRIGPRTASARGEPLQSNRFVYHELNHARACFHQELSQRSVAPAYDNPNLSIAPSGFLHERVPFGQHGLQRASNIAVKVLPCCSAQSNVIIPD